ncbi:hypothetical protein H6795_02860 [Candidatus Nomurabacteria bacterium]|nr:hypothetical protein [Candidatus Nomurabacteria bacterium]
MTNKLEGTLVLYKTTLRLSIKTALPWIMGVTMLAVTSHIAYGNLFPTLEDQRNLTMTVQANPAFNLIFGNVNSLMSAEGFTAWRTVVLGSFLVSLMSILLVIKHTRAKEDSGEEELIASSVVGRYTILTVALAIAFSASFFAGAFVSGLLIAIGASAASSLALGATLATAGVFFGSVAAFTAQLTSDSRTATSFAVTFLGFSYLIRGVADTVDGASWMASLSPLGWAQKTDVSATNNYAPLLALLFFGAIVMTLAYMLKSKRDFGQGIIADKPGNARAGRSGTIFGLAFRLQRTAIIGWTLAFIFVGATFGYLLASVGDTFATNEGISRFIGAQGAQGINFTFEFAKTLLTIIGIVIAAYGTQVVFRLISEESSHRIEPLLAGSVTRRKMFSSHVAIALTGTFLAMIIVGLMIAGIAHFNDTNIEPVKIIIQSLLTAPAMLVLVSISVALVGFKPRLRGLAWLAIAISFGLTILGPILQLSDKVLAISPFWHVTDGSLDHFSLGSSVAMMSIVISMLVIGFIGYRHRDIATT